MGDFGELFLVLAAIYLIESSMWVPSGRVALGGGWSRRSIGSGTAVLGRGRRRLMLLSPWPPLMGAYLSARLATPDDLELGTAGDDASEIRASVLRAFDGAAIASRRDELRRRTRALRVATHLLFVHLFVLAPALAFVPGLGRLWTPWLIGLAVLLVLVEVTFFRAHARLFPSAREDRWTRVFMLVSPPSAVRALDALMRPLLQTFHPVAIAREVAEREVFVQRLAQALRELAFTAPAPVPPDPRLQALQAALREGLEALARAEGLEPAALLAAPPRHDPSSIAYCPRCHVEFARADVVCGDCGGIPVSSHPSTT